MIVSGLLFPPKSFGGPERSSEIADLKRPSEIYQRGKKKKEEEGGEKIKKFETLFKV